MYLSFFAPLCIYCTKLSTDYLTRGLLVIYLTTTIGVYYLFIIGLFDISNLDRVQNLLRPKEYHAATIGTIPRVGGYQGSNHDAANILTIIGIFLLANIMSKKSKYKLISILSLLLGTPALLITTSASNISVFIFTAVIMLICYAKNILKFSALLLFISIFFISLYYFSNEYLFIFLKKFINHSEASDGGMFNSLDGEYIYASLFSFLLGFAYPLELPIINTEIGLLKLLVTLGIIPFSLLVYFLTLPFIICLKNRLNYHFSFYSFPIISCLLTLLHYGSLFRITSIGILVLLYSLFLNKYTSYMHSKNTFG